MTALIAALCLGPPALAAWIWLHLHLDTRRTWADETDTWHGVTLDQLPVPREELTPLPQRAAVIEPEHDVQVDAPSTDLLERVRDALHRWGDPEYQPRHLYPLGETSGARRDGRHRTEVADGSCAQQARTRAIRTPTAEFDVIVRLGWNTAEREALAWRCDSCRVGWDPERPHMSCTGCGCPCTVAVSPGGVELVAIGGRR